MVLESFGSLKTQMSSDFAKQFLVLSLKTRVDKINLTEPQSEPEQKFIFVQKKIRKLYTEHHLKLNQIKNYYNRIE